MSINKHEHNWGSDSDISTYSYSRAYKDFVLKTKETTSTSGDGLRSDTFEFYDVSNARYKVENTCGSLEEGCKPYNRTGRILLTKPPSTLLKPQKIHRDKS